MLPLLAVLAWFSSLGLLPSESSLSVTDACAFGLWVCEEHWLRDGHLESRPNASMMTVTGNIKYIAVIGTSYGLSHTCFGRVGGLEIGQVLGVILVVIGLLVLG